MSKAAPWDHRGAVAFSQLYPLSHLNLGRAYVQQGDTAKARAAYRISSLCGKMPTRTSPSSNRRRRVREVAIESCVRHAINSSQVLRSRPEGLPAIGCLGSLPAPPDEARFR